MTLNATHHEEAAVIAVKFLRKMRGKTQSLLLEADDKHSYVVKFWEPEVGGSRILVNEWLGHAVMEAAQINTPPIRFVRITEQFIQANSLVFQVAGRYRKIKPGLHFGSRYLASGTTAVWDFLPDALLPRVSNIGDFNRALVCDLWLCNADRQAIFRGSKGSRLFEAYMIDFDLCFAGTEWSLDNTVGGAYLRPIVYSETVEKLDQLLEELEQYHKTLYDRACLVLPSSWVEHDLASLKQLIEGLAPRLHQLPNLIADVLRSLKLRRAPQCSRASLR